MKTINKKGEEQAKMPAAHMKKQNFSTLLITAIIILSMMCGCDSVPASQTTDTVSETVSVTETSSSTESSDESEKRMPESSKKSEISYSPNYSYSSDTESSSEPENESSYEPETNETSTYGQKHYEKATAEKYIKKINDKNSKNFVTFYDSVTNEQDLFRTDGKNTLWYFFDFDQEGTIGIGIFDKTNSDKYNEDYVNDTNVAYTEMYYGFKAEIIDGRTLSVENYTHLSGVKYIDLEIQSERPDIIHPEYVVAYNRTTLTADLYDESFINGCYVITGTYEYEGETNTCNLYLYVNCKSNDPSDYNFYICHGENSGHQYEDDDLPNDINKNTNKLIKRSNITPENSLNLNIAYPCCALDSQTFVFDTPNWVAKSKEIVANYKSASKAFKATLLHDWIVKNMAYDNYRMNCLDGKPRYKNHCDTDSFYPSNSHIGVCIDFANIYMIMCRSQGIPCVTCENEEENHVWNMVYIDGQWVEVDVTFDINYHVRTKNTNKWEGTLTHPYDYYFNHPAHNAHDAANSTNKCLYVY